MTVSKRMSTGKGWFAASAAAILALVLVGGLMVSGSAQAAPNTVRIDPADASVAPGANVALNVVAEAPANNIGGWVLSVSYDASVLQLVPGTEDACTGGQSACNSPSAGTVNVGGTSSTTAGLSGTQVLATLTFKAVGADGTSSTIGLLVPDLSDKAGEQTGAIGTGGKVSVKVPAATSSPSPSPSPTAKALPVTGGAASDGSSSVPWALGVLGLAVLAGGVWVTARTRRETL